MRQDVLLAVLDLVRVTILHVADQVLLISPGRLGALSRGHSTVLAHFDLHLPRRHSSRGHDVLVLHPKGLRHAADPYGGARPKIGMEVMEEGCPK